MKMQSFRILTIPRLLAINAVVAGLEIAACVAFTFIPPLLLKAGFTETNMSIILGVAPFLALFTVPRMGQISDSCTSRWGRRRPFISLLSLLLVFSLMLLYLGESLSTDARWMRMVILAVGVVLLDYASQAAINPCEALMSDIMAGQTEMSEETGFSFYSGMLSIGSCIGYLLSALDWAKFGLTVGSREQTAFLLVLFLYVLCWAITMVAAREKPHRIDRLDSNGKEEVLGLLVGKAADKGGQIKTRSQWLVDSGGQPGSPETGSDPGYGSDEEVESQVGPRWSRPRSLLPRFRCSLSSLLFSPLSLLCALPRLLLHMISLPVNFYHTITNAPPALRGLFVTDLTSWVAIMAHGMFYTDFVATAVYGGQPDAAPGSVYDLLFDEGVRMGSWGLLLHSITAGVYALFIQEHITKLLGLKRSYQFGLAVFAISMAVTVLSTNSLTSLNLAAAASGVGFSVITTVPNTIVTLYHEDAVLYYGAAAGRGGVGEDIAVLDTGYYLSQIGLSLVMGRLVEMTGLPHYYIIVSCVAGIAAVIFANKVVTCPEEARQSRVLP